MTNNHFIALLKSFLLTFVTGILFTLLATFIYHQTMSDVGIDMVVGFFASFITAIMMCGLWLPVVTLLDKQKLLDMDAASLFSRHLPFVAIPFVIIFIIMYAFDNAATELAIVVIEIMFTAFASIYIYFRMIKKKNFWRDEIPEQNQSNPEL